MDESTRLAKETGQLLSHHLRDTFHTPDGKPAPQYVIADAVGEILAVPRAYGGILTHYLAGRFSGGLTCSRRSGGLGLEEVRDRLGRALYCMRVPEDSLIITNLKQLEWLTCYPPKTRPAQISETLERK